MNQPSAGTGRRAILIAAGLLPLAGLARAAALSSAVEPVEVWKEPTCGCCKDWIAHLESSGFKVFVNVGGTMEARQRMGVPAAMSSCHTARVAGYAIEGHVPAREIKRLLRERPDAIGLAAPGMPLGAPGMDTPVYNGKKNPFDVMLLARNGRASIYQHYEGTLL